MSENLTNATKELLDLARKEAAWRGSPRVGPVHLLLSLLTSPSGGAARMFHQLAVSPERLRPAISRLAELEARLDPSSASPSKGDTELGVGVQRLLEVAASLAREHGHEQVDTDHVLVAFVSDGKENLKEELGWAGLTLDSVRPILKTRGSLKDDILDVEGVIAKSRSKVTLRDLEKKGFRKVKVAPETVAEQLVKARLQDLRDRRLSLANANAEYQRQEAEFKDLQRQQEQIEAATKDLERKLAEANAQLVSRRNALLQQVALANPARGPLTCPRGHAVMESVLRDGVRLAVCPECMSTFLEPGQLEALVRRLSELSVDALHEFLEPESPD